jgi:two-component sensor histidine kinase
VNNIREKYENEKYKAQISQVSGELRKSEKHLGQKKRENLIIYVSLAILVILILTIALLARKISRANKTLTIKNNEKDTLIQEIHHRVKNNLQFVSSLINMQINSSKTSLEVDSLSDASRRIRSMALVHEMLYNQDDLRGIEIKKYLTELISSINDIVNSKKIPISFNIACEVMMFETSKAIALGMITSELVSNSIKYAFAETAEPQIDIDLHKLAADDNISFSVRDNGKGFVVGTQDATEKLGMRLISIFSRQMKGEYTFNNNKGLVYTLIFKDAVNNGKS